MGKYYFDFSRIESKQRKKLLTGSVVPRPIAWITTKNENGSINLAPFSYFNAFSETIVGVSFSVDGDNHKDTYHNVLREKEAVIHIVDVTLMEMMDKSSRPLEKNESELEWLNLPTTESRQVGVDALQDPLIRIEVRFEQEIPLMSPQNHMESVLVLFRVVGMVVDERVYDADKGYILTDNLRPLARLGGPHYGTIAPLDFKRQY